MKLHRLSIRAFKGIDNFTIEPRGKNTTIRGKNGTGKTTIADAYAWLMTGKGFDGKTIDTQIKRRSEDGSEPNDGGIEHNVKAMFITDDNHYVTLSRTFKEKWEKKRGTAETEFRGHTSTYEADGVPLSKKEYDKKVEALTGGQEAFQLLSMPLHFCTLRWDKRREILIDMCGQVTDDSIIEQNKELEPLKELLGGHSVDDFRKMTQASIKEANKNLEAIPARIDELTRQMQAESPMPKDKAESELSELTALRKQKQKQLVELENGGLTGELQQQLAGIEADMTRFKTQFEDSYKRKSMEAERTANGCRAEIERLGLEMERNQKEVERLETCIKTAENLAAKLREEWQGENKRVPAVEVDYVCPTCGQVMPADKIEVLKQKVLEDFNLQKSHKLKEITEKGKRIVSQNKTDAATIEKLKERDKAAQEQIDTYSAKLKEAEGMMQGMEKPDVSKEEEYISLQKKWEMVQAKLTANATDNEAQIMGIQSDLQAIEQDIGYRNNILAGYRQQEGLVARVEELKEEEATLGDTVSKLQRSLFLTEEFMRAKVRTTEAGINSHFQYVHWKMFNTRINGALEECCEPMIDGVPFGDGLNKGNRMKAALDILNALSKFYGKKLPVFIDDCESYTSLPAVDTQVIKLIVDAQCDALCIEIEEDK